MLGEPERVEPAGLGLEGQLDRLHAEIGGKHHDAELHGQTVPIRHEVRDEQPGMRFSIDDYQQIVRPVMVDDLDLDHAFAEHPLTDDVLRCLRYMHDIELHTVCYLRDLLVTSAHRDPEITTFLTLWSYEEYWHGEAIARVLRAHGEIAGLDRVQKLRRRRR